MIVAFIQGTSETGHQLRALRDYAKKNGYIVAREYVDEAESGRIADRPEFRKMIDAATKPSAPFREILVWKFSRFTRKRENAVAFKSMLRRKGVRLSRLLGFQLRPLRLQPGDGAGRGQEAPHLPYTSVETERGAGGGAFTHRVPPEWVRYQELKLSITISLALMITAMLRYSATAVAYVTAYGTPGRVDMGNVGSID